MSEYVDKDKVLEYIIFNVVGKNITCGELARGIESLPTIEVSERTEEWEEDIYHREHCSNCGYIKDVFASSNFCPNCGADMRSEEKYI